MLKQYEIPVAYSMVELAQQSAKIAPNLFKNLCAIGLQFSAQTNPPNEFKN